MQKLNIRLIPSFLLLTKLLVLQNRMIDRVTGNGGQPSTDVLDRYYGPDWSIYQFSPGGAVERVQNVHAATDTSVHSTEPHYCLTGYILMYSRQIFGVNYQ